MQRTPAERHQTRKDDARRSPDDFVLWPEDLARMLRKSVRTIHSLDAAIPHHRDVTPSGKKSRRYSWNGFQAYLARTAVGQLLEPAPEDAHATR